MERDFRHFRHLLLFFFDQAKQYSDAHDLMRKTYLESAPAITTCRRWFRRFEGGDFDLQLFSWDGKRKLKDEDVLKLLNKNPNITQAEMARHFNVANSTIYRHLKGMTQFQNQRNHFDLASQTGSHLNVGRTKKVITEDLKKLLNKNPNISLRAMAKQFNVSHMTNARYLKTLRLNQRNHFDLANQIRYTTCISLLSRHNTENFLDQVVTGGVMSIFYETLNQIEATTSNKNELKICIWWDTESVIYYEMLRSNEGAFNLYSQQLYKLKQELDSKQPQLTNNRRKVILLHTSFAEINILKSVKEQILEFGWEVLPYPASIVDSAPSYDVFPHLDDTHKYLLSTCFDDVERRSKIMIPFFDAHLFARGIYSLPENWEKCIQGKKSL